METYFNCHSHTEYSNIRLLDCINKPKDLIDKAIELGLSGIAITDHECLSGHVKINQYAAEIKEKYPNFKVALGNEIYLTDTRDKGQKYYHFILIAKDALGHKALRELSSTAWYNSYYDRGMERVPTLKSELTEVMSKYKGHVIATTACIGGELSYNALGMSLAEEVNDQKVKAWYYKNICDFIDYCLNIFGDDFYIECAPSTAEDQVIVNKKLRSIASYYHIKMTLGTDAHYLTAKERPIHKAYLNSKDGEREIDSFYEFAHLMSPEEAKNILQSSFDDDFINELYSNSQEIADKIEDYSLFHKQDIPRVEVKDYPKMDCLGSAKRRNLERLFMSDDVQDRYWVNECFNSLIRLGKENDERYLDELEEEARVKSIISEKLETNMFRYPNTLQHYIDMIWDCGSMVGAGRGSSCAALNHYLMGITQLDPIEWNLPFFRYLNDERVELGCLILILPSCKKRTLTIA